MSTLAHNTAQVVRYGTVTALSYAALLGGTYVGVDLLDLPATPTYAVVLTIVYIGVYLSSSRFVFRTPHSPHTLARFLTALVFLWALNSSVFFLLESYLGLHYLVAAIINVLVFGPLRFLLNKWWVFRNLQNS